MTSPFDITKVLTQTKEDIYTTEELFNKEYTPFMVNRILSNSSSTALFSDMMNQYPALDKKLQYDFYFTGIPKSKGYSKYAKKEESGFDQAELDYLAHSLGVSVRRAIELYSLIGQEKIKEDMALRGGET